MTDATARGSADAAGATDATGVTRLARRGAFWSLVIAGVAFPLPILRNWFAGQIDTTGTLNGQLQLFILFVTAVYTFFYPGGRNVFPTFLPKLRDARERSQLITGYVLLVATTAVIAVVITTLFPGILESMLSSRSADAGQLLTPETSRVLRWLIPFVLLSLLFTSAVMGYMSFVWASLLLRVELVIVTGLFALGYWGLIDITTDSATMQLGVAFGVATLLACIVAGVVLFREHRPMWPVRFPKGCFRFAGLTWLDTVMVFAYLAVDKYFVASFLGVAALGVYGVLLDLARLIPLAMQQVGHLLLATFSKLLGTGQEEALSRAYRSVTRVTVGFYATSALFFVFFSRPLASIFGPEFEARHAVLIGLAVALSIDALKTINAMTLMAYERMGTVMFSKLAQNVVQFGVIFLTIRSWGLAGVVLGKAAGHVVNAVISCVAVANVQRTHPLLPPRAFGVLQPLVAIAGMVAYWLDGESMLWSACGLVVGWAAVWFVGGYSVCEIRALLPNRQRSAAT